MSGKDTHKSKKWIDPNTTGFIYTHVKFDYNWDATLKMADCARIVSFDVYIDDEKARRKSLKKLNLMIHELSKFRNAIEGIVYVN